MAQTPLRLIAFLLDPSAPNRAVSRLIRVPKSTARSWLRGTRHPPLPVLESIREAAQARARELNALANNGGEIDALIWQRRMEPKRAPRGCCARKRHG
jgi:hypothetical protein